MSSPPPTDVEVVANDHPIDHKNHVLLYVFLIFIIIFITGVPFLDGYLFKQKYLSFLQALSRETNTDFQVEEYHLGWLHSSATLHMSSTSKLLENMYAPNKLKSEGMILKQRIKHGPLLRDPIRNAIVFGFAALQTRAYLVNENETSTDYANQGSIQIATFADFSGHFFNKLNLLGVFFQIPFVGKLSWDGLRGTINMKASEKHIDQIHTNFEISPIIIESNFGSLNISDSSFESETTRQGENFWKGSQILSIPTVTLEEETHSCKLNQLKVNHSFGSNKNHFYDSTLKIDIDEIIGANIIINPMSILLSATNLNADAMHEFINRSYHSLLQLNSLDKALARLFTTDTTITTNLKLNTNQGHFYLNVKWYLSKKTIKLEHVKDLIENINYDANLHINSPFKPVICYYFKSANAYGPENTALIRRQRIIILKNKLMIYNNKIKSQCMLHHKSRSSRFTHRIECV